jgi:hypothetical protein
MIEAVINELRTLVKEEYIMVVVYGSVAGPAAVMITGRRGTVLGDGAFLVSSGPVVQLVVGFLDHGSKFACGHRRLPPGSDQGNSAVSSPSRE